MAKMSMKGLPIKQFLFNHFEKMLLGICALLAIWTLTQNQWVGSRESPTALIAKSKEAEKRLADSAWPESEKQKLILNDYQEYARKIPVPVDGELFAVKGSFFWPLTPKKVPASEPTWYPVEDLIVDADRAILALKGTPEQPQVATVKPDEGKEALAKTEPETPKNLPGLGELPTAEDPARPTGPGNIDYRGVSTAVTGLSSGRSGINLAQLGGLFGGRGRDDEEDAAQAIGGAAPGAGQIAPVQQVRGDDGRGYRYVSVRGIYPWKKQLSELVDSKTFESLVQADNPELFSIMDFQLERMEAIPGADPWSGQWEKIDVAKVQTFLLEKSFDFDPDPVDPADTDPAITMPIPMRAFGGWPVSQVIHPRIQALKQQQLEEALKSQKELAKDEEALKKEDESSKSKGGFYGVVRSGRAVRNYQAISPDGEEDDRKGGRGRRRGGAAPATAPVAGNSEDDDRGGGLFGGRGGGMFGGGGAGGMAQPMASVQTYMGPELMLFRFFDLSVDPGRTYQYRVRLVLTNPNANKTLADVMDPAVREGKTRETPWSKPSSAVEIPNDYDVFLAKIRSGHFQNPLDGAAGFHVYEWEPSIGTFILGFGQVRYGDMITFLGRSRVIRFHKRTSDFENIDFKTQDVLLDGFISQELKPNEHPDLELTGTSADRPVEGLLLDEAVVMNQFGELEMLDPYSRKDDLAQAKNANDATLSYVEFLNKTVGTEATAGANGNPLSRRSGRRGREEDGGR